MMLAEITTADVLTTASTVGLFVVAMVALFRKSDVRFKQPVTVEIVEEMHKQFASKETFDKHVEQNRLEVAELKAERRVDNNLLHEKINKVDRDVGAVKKETEIQSQQLSRIDSKLDRLVERK